MPGDKKNYPYEIGIEIISINYLFHIESSDLSSKTHFFIVNSFIKAPISAKDDPSKVNPDL